MFMKISWCGSAISAVAILFFAHTPAQAWGLKGHTMIGQAAMAHLPADVPAFLRSDDAKNEIIYLQAEEDRLKIGTDMDRAWSREWSTDHYLDVDDNSMIGGVLSLTALPETRDSYIKALWSAAKPTDPYSVGFLPYAILEGYEQVRADFALWRLAPAAERDRRASLTIHDIGIFSHFVGDGSQPLHVSVHFNGWGDYPNPQDYTDSHTFHEDYETHFVDDNVTVDDVSPLVGTPKILPDVPLGAIEHYILESNARVVPLYDLAKRGAMDATGTPATRAELVSLTSDQLAAAATMLDSLIETAWRSSATLKE